MKLLIFCLIILFSTSSYANEKNLTSSDIIIAQKWLSEQGGEHWKIFYNEWKGKKYQWIISKQIFDNTVHISFITGKQINEGGKIIGGNLNLREQFFTLVINRKTYKLKQVLLGG